MGLLFGDGGLFNRIGNAIAGNGFIGDSQVAMNQQAQALKQQQLQQQHSADMVNRFSNMNAPDMLKNLIANDPANSSAYSETLLNYKLNSPKQKMQDLKDAGINPLMAVNGGTTFDSSPQISTAMAQQQNREARLDEKFKELQLKYAKLGLQKETLAVNTAKDVFKHITPSADAVFKSL